MGWPLRSSIEHIDHMLVFMGLVSQVACRHQMFGFTPTASLAAIGEKLGMDPWIGQRRAVDCAGSPFSQEQWACSILSMTHQRLPHTGTTHRKHTPGVRRLEWEAYVSCWLGFYLHGVRRFKSP